MFLMLWAVYFVFLIITINYSSLVVDLAFQTEEDLDDFHFISIALLHSEHNFLIFSAIAHSIFLIEYKK